MGRLKSRNLPLISIITVCFNAHEYIEQCMNSVIYQNFDRYEYIVIDGGSTDGTVEIIKKHSDRLAYWHSKPDRGIAHGFNLGLEHASGEWIVFLNSDDYFANDNVLGRFGLELSGLESVDVAFGQVRNIERQAEEKVLSSALVGNSFKWADFIKQDTIPHPASFTQRSYFEHYGMFDEDYMIAMDYELFLRAGKSIRTRFIPILVTKMREGGVSRSMQVKCYQEWKMAHVKNRKVLLSYIYLYYCVHRARIFLKSIC